MASKKTPAAMPRPLQLTPDEYHTILVEADRVISKTMAVNEIFIASNRQLPTSEWKLVKSKESVMVYRARKTAKMHLGDEAPDPYSQHDAAINGGDNLTVSLNDTAASSRGDSSASDDVRGRGSGGCGGANQAASLPKPTDMPLVIATGVISGSVDDVAFGNLAYTEQLTRYRDAHIGDEYADTKILATILQPTVRDPFESLVVKWSTKSVGAFSRMRDCVFIEANGIAAMTSGERVAYHLVHSLDCIPRIPGFKHLDIVRVNMSTCYISRQYDQSSIEVFCRGFADLGGSFAEQISSNVYTKTVLSVVHVIDYAYVKKLIWLAHTKLESSSVSRSDTATHCGSCAAKLSVLVSLLHAHTACQACRQEICSRCSVTKRLVVEGSSSAEMKSKTAIFCLHCVLEAKQLPAREVAAAKIQTAALH